MSMSVTGGALGTSAATPGTNSLGTALSSPHRQAHERTTAWHRSFHRPRRGQGRQDDRVDLPRLLNACLWRHCPITIGGRVIRRRPWSCVRTFATGSNLSSRLTGAQIKLYTPGCPDRILASSSFTTRHAFRVFYVGPGVADEFVAVRHLDCGKRLRVERRVRRQQTIEVENIGRDGINVVVTQGLRRILRHRAADVIKQGRRVRPITADGTTGFSVVSVPCPPASLSPMPPSPLLPWQAAHC